MNPLTQQTNTLINTTGIQNILIVESAGIVIGNGQVSAQ